MLNNEKSKQELDWFPKLDINRSLEWTLEWYLNYYNNKNMLNFTIDQITEYENS